MTTTPAVAQRCPTCEAEPGEPRRTVQIGLARGACPDLWHVELTPNQVLATLSHMIDSSRRYQGVPREAVDWRRTMKVVEEIGEAVTAFAGTLGENPRKGVTHTGDDVDRELLDVVVSALGTLMHFHGNDPRYDAFGALVNHLRSRAARLAAALPPEPADEYVVDAPPTYLDIGQA